MLPPCGSVGSFPHQGSLEGGGAAPQWALSCLQGVTSVYCAVVESVGSDVTRGCECGSVTC